MMQAKLTIAALIMLNMLIDCICIIYRKSAISCLLLQLMKIVLRIYFLGLLIIITSNCNLKNKIEEQANEDKIILGRYLFFDTKLSLNNTKSCASCHSPAFAFSDGYRTSATPLGENVLHNSPSLLNAVYLKKYDWANPNATSFETQIKRPLYGNHPIELGLDKHINELQEILKKDSLYPILFQKAFPDSNKLFTLSQIEMAISTYEKKLVSESSNFDKNKLSSSANNGLKLFTSKRLNCSSCHPPPYFTLATLSSNIDSVYANIGLYNVNNKNEYPTNDNGIYNITHQSKDNGKFKIPSLRNVMLTAPYMHDGSIATINEVIEMYARGGRFIDYGNNKGDGKLNRNKSKLIAGFILSKDEKRDLINFLTSLTDSSIFYKQMFKNPFIKN
jgi:cytochrome c peroxidase